MGSVCNVEEKTKYGGDLEEIMVPLDTSSGEEMEAVYDCPNQMYSYVLWSYMSNPIFSTDSVWLNNMILKLQKWGPVSFKFLLYLP